MASDNSTVTYRDIPGWPGYRVGDDGSVWSCLGRGGVRVRRLTSHWRLMRPYTNEKGYQSVILISPEGSSRRLKVHRLVLEAFVGPCPEGMECRHFPDNNRSNNRLENLSWATHQRNVDDRESHGTNLRGESAARSKLTEAQVREIRERYAEGGVSTRKLGTEYGVTGQMIHDIVARRCWKHI